MRRITGLVVACCMVVLACTKKAMPGSSHTGKTKAAETAEGQKTDKSKESPAPDGSDKDRVATATPVKDKESTTAPSSPGSGTEAPNKPSGEEMGKSVYTSKCNKCHGVKNVKNYTFNQWESILKTMIPNAKLTADEESYVLTYIRANSK